MFWGFGVFLEYFSLVWYLPTFREFSKLWISFLSFGLGMGKQRYWDSKYTAQCQPTALEMKSINRTKTGAASSFLHYPVDYAPLSFLPSLNVVFMKSRSCFSSFMISISLLQLPFSLICLLSSLSHTHLVSPLCLACSTLKRKEHKRFFREWVRSSLLSGLALISQSPWRRFEGNMSYFKYSIAARVWLSYSMSSAYEVVYAQKLH